jgi:hypothetical protein
MELSDLVGQVDGFDNFPPREKIRLFAWWLHTYKGVEQFENDAIRDCYRQLHLPLDNVPKYVERMIAASDLAKERAGLKLTRQIRGQLDTKYGVHQSVVEVSKLLTELPGKVPDLSEKNFLAEAIRCYRVKAYRACVVMMWNLAYSHLLHWILADERRLADFNAAIVKRYPKKAALTVRKYDDFEEFRESELIEVCNSANLVSGNIIRILREKLGKRNNAAHPASVVIVQAQADDVVTDLTNNVVLMLPV